MVAGLQLGVYEDVYLIYGMGKYSQGDLSTEYDEARATGTFINQGISYHFVSKDNKLLSLDFIQRKMQTTTYEEKEYHDSEKSHDATTLMLNFTWFKPGGHTGFELGAGIGGTDAFVFRVGLKFRYF